MTPETQTFILSLVIKVLIVIAIPFLAKVVYDLYVQGVAYLKTNLSAAQLASVKAVVNFLVLSAEQAGLTGSVLKTGAEKKAWVLSEAKRILTDLGLEVFADNVETLSSLLEAAVYSNFNQFQWPDITDPVTPAVTSQAASAVVDDDDDWDCEYNPYDDFQNIVDLNGHIESIPKGDLYALLGDDVDGFTLQKVPVVEAVTEKYQLPPLKPVEIPAPTAAVPPAAAPATT